MTPKMTLLVGAVLASLAATTARAGVIDWTKVEFSGDTTINCTTPNYTYNNDNHNVWWQGASMLIEDVEVPVTQDTHTYYMNIDADPTVNLSTWVYNMSGIAWNAYDFTVTSNTPGVTVVFSGTPTSGSYLLDTPSQTASTLHFSGVSSNTPLTDGNMAMLSYNLTITPPDGFSGGISYTMTMTPTVVPEPMALSLLGLGTTALLLRRRR